MLLYDASSIINLLKHGVTKVFAEGVTIELAVYEAVNALWKECYLLKRIKVETAQRFLELLEDIFETIDIYSIKGFEGEAFKISLNEDITFYDASYICVAVKNDLTLVTDDRKLRDVSSKYVRVLASFQLYKFLV